MKSGLFAPTSEPFTLHWKDGDAPPLTGVAVKVTGMPPQTGLEDAAIETLTGNSGFTVMITVADVAGFPVAHGFPEVITQLTASPFEGTKLNDGLLPPVFVPFTFHW